jgi:hypothetical protein
MKAFQHWLVIARFRHNDSYAMAFNVVARTGVEAIRKVVRLVEDEAAYYWESEPEGAAVDRLLVEGS